MVHTIDETGRARADKINSCRNNCVYGRLNNMASSIDERSHLKGSCRQDLVLDPEGKAVCDSL